MGVILRGYMPWKPTGATRDLIEQIEKVLDEYAAFLPLSLRQLFYRLVATIAYPKDDLAYRRLGEKVNRARRAGIVPWDAIRDDSIIEEGPNLTFASKQQLISMTRSFVADWCVPDLAVNQPRHIEVACEAAGMVEQLARVARPLGVFVRSSGGTDSLTFKHQIATRIARTGKPAYLLHLGDLDPDGEDIYDVLNEEITAFCANDAPGLPVTCRRLAMTADLARLHGVYDLGSEVKLKIDPKTGEVKRGSRAARWIAEGRGNAVQLEALPPGVIAAVLEDAIRDIVDLDQIEADRAAREADRARVRVSG